MESDEEIQDYSYEVDDDGFIDDAFIDDTDTLENEIVRQKSWEVLTPQEIEKRGKEVISEVQDFLGLPTITTAITLLRFYKWNKEKLIQDYTSGDPEKINKAAGITSFDLESKPKSNHLKFNCLICLEPVPMKNTFALACGHRYCTPCYGMYLDYKVTCEGPSCVNGTCPYPKCTEIVHDKAYTDLLNPANVDLYKKYTFRAMVEGNPHIKFCPAPDCSRAIRSERRNRKEAVICACGFRWCFQCADYEISDHMPATCENVEKWRQKATDESENVKWMIANTKKCPRCRKPIEKNGGCMHMNCRKEFAGCGHEFCWLCRGDWKEHGTETGGYYACNKYSSSMAKEDDTKAAQIKTELEAYMFYFHRYESHQRAMKIAEQQRLQTDKKDTILDKFTVRAQDTQFLKEATEQLINNRRVLKNSYIYGFYKES